MSSQNLSTYTVGQIVSFEGRPGMIEETFPGPVDMAGRATQLLRVSTYAGISLIGSAHSALRAA